MPIVSVEWGGLSAVTEVATLEELRSEVRHTYKNLKAGGDGKDGPAASPAAFSLCYEDSGGRRHSLETDADLARIDTLFEDCTIRLSDGFPRVLVGLPNASSSSSAAAATTAAASASPAAEATAAEEIICEEDTTPDAAAVATTTAAVTPPAPAPPPPRPAVASGHVLHGAAPTQRLSAAAAVAGTAAPSRMEEEVELPSTPEMPPSVAVGAPPAAVPLPPPPPPPPPEVGCLRVTVVGAKGLADKDSIGLSDPYTVVELEGHQAQQTPVLDGTCDPQWDHVSTFDIRAPQDLLLKLTVYDADPVGKDLLGACEVLLSRQLQAKALANERAMSVQLRDDNGRTGAGTLQLRIAADPAVVAPQTAAKQTAPPAAAPPPPTTTLPEQLPTQPPAAAAGSEGVAPEGWVCPDVLVVTVAKAMDLVDRDGLGRGDSDPYVTMEFEGHETSTSSVADGSLRPVWDHRVTYELGGRSTGLVRLTVFDSDLGPRDDFLGYAELRVTPALLQSALRVSQRLVLRLTARPGNAEDDAWVRECGGAGKQGKVFVTLSAVVGAASHTPDGAVAGSGNAGVAAKRASSVPNQLTLSVLKAANLADPDAATPYVVAECAGLPTLQTPTADGSPNPSWNHRMTFDLPAPLPASLPVTLRLFDAAAGREDSLGTASLVLTDALLAAVMHRSKQVALSILSPAGTKAGTLFVALQSARNAEVTTATAAATLCPSVMEVVVERAEGLVDRDTFGESDPFVTLSVDGFPENQTQVLDGTLSPVWGYKALYDLAGKDRHLLKLTVHDSDPVGADFLGYAEVLVTPHMLRKALRTPQELALRLTARPGNKDDEKWMAKAGVDKLGRLFLSIRAVAAPPAVPPSVGAPAVSTAAASRPVREKLWWCIGVAKATGLCQSGSGEGLFVVLEAEGRAAQKTAAASDAGCGDEPEWGDEFAVDLAVGEALGLTVFDGAAAAAASSGRTGGQKAKGRDGFLGYCTLQISELFAAQAASRVSLRLRPRPHNKSDAKLASKHNGNLGQLHLIVTPNTTSSGRVDRRRPASSSGTKKGGRSATNTTGPGADGNTRKDAKDAKKSSSASGREKKASKRPASSTPLPPPPPPSQTLPPPQPSMSDDETEALKALLGINPLARSKAALHVGRVWKDWSWQQRLAVARQVELGVAPSAAFLTSPLRASYRRAAPPHGWAGEEDNVEEERVLQERFDRLWGSGTTPRLPSPTRIDGIIAERKRQALRDLEEERKVRGSVPRVRAGVGSPARTR